MPTDPQVDSPLHDPQVAKRSIYGHSSPCRRRCFSHESKRFGGGSVKLSGEAPRRMGAARLGGSVANTLCIAFSRIIIIITSPGSQAQAIQITVRLISAAIE